MRSKLQLAIAAGMLSTLAFAQEPPQTMIFRHGATAGVVGGPQTFEYMATQSFSFDGCRGQERPVFRRSSYRDHAEAGRWKSNREKNERYHVSRQRR